MPKSKWEIFVEFWQKKADILAELQGEEKNGDAAELLNGENGEMVEW